MNQDQKDDMLTGIGAVLAVLGVTLLFIALWVSNTSTTMKLGLSGLALFILGFTAIVASEEGKR